VVQVCATPQLWTPAVHLAFNAVRVNTKSANALKVAEY
jgi:hypothetical protein